MKARFLTQQLPVKWQELGNGLVDVTICMNEVKCEESFEDAVQVYYEYDCNQFREDITKLNKSHMENNPGAYLDYVPECDVSLEELVKEQQTRIEELEGCLLEVSEIIYA